MLYLPVFNFHIASETLHITAMHVLQGKVEPCVRNQRDRNGRNVHKDKNITANKAEKYKMHIS